MAGDYREHDPDLDDFPYKRPAVASWIAAIAVAFAFFTLGGFIKTYRQLESLREESRREIEELRQNLKRLQSTRQAAAPERPRRQDLSSLPAAKEWPTRDAGAPPRSVPRPNSAALDLSRLAMEQGETKSRSGVSLEIGNKSPDDPLALLQKQVISVSAPKMVMVEGGRDMGRAERMRLALYRSGSWIADVRVTEVFDTMSSCEILHSTTPPQPGDSVRNPAR